MTVAIALIRGINVGGRNSLPMAALRALCEQAGLRDVRTYIQSGNVLFRIPPRQVATIGATLEEAIESARGFRPCIAVRTAEELGKAAAANPFSGGGFDPARVLVMFLLSEPDHAAGERLGGVIKGRETVAVRGREVYLYFPDGIGTSKLSLAAIEKAAGIAGTTRNLNTVSKLLEMAASMNQRP